MRVSQTDGCLSIVAYVMRMSKINSETGNLKVFAS